MPFPRQNLGMKTGRIVGLCVALTFVLTGCGESSKLYPSSKADGVFFSVPKTWNSLSTAALNKYEMGASDKQISARRSLVKWQIAYTTDPKMKVSQVFTLKPPTSPLVFARVRDLTATEINEFSYNSLRDVVTPITQLLAGVDLGAPDFKIISDEVIVEKGARGIHTVYSFSIDGVEQTLNQRALMSNDHSILYFLLARCATTCYAKNKKVMEEIVNSYTVQGAK